jgi:hypothetical protein
MDLFPQKNLLIAGTKFEERHRRVVCQPEHDGTVSSQGSNSNGAPIRKLQAAPKVMKGDFSRLQPAQKTMT